MAGEIDLFLQEKETGKKFANRVKRNLLSTIRSKTNDGLGLAMKSTARPVYKFGLLDRITLFTPYYIYPILDHGFEGKKKNGVNSRLKAKNFFSEALENGKLVNDLADVVGNQRAQNIMLRTQFAFDSDLKTSNTLGK